MYLLLFRDPHAVLPVTEEDLQEIVGFPYPRSWKEEPPGYLNGGSPNPCHSRMDAGSEALEKVSPVEEV